MTPVQPPPSLEALLAPISEQEVRATYTAAPRLGIDDNRTVVNLQLLVKTLDGNKVTCTVTFETTAGEPILERELERWFCDNKRLLGQDGRAKVVYRVWFVTRSNFQKQGFAQYILSKEEELFQRWGAIEIQVTAMYEGRWVWTRPKFGYSMHAFDFDLLQQRYLEWQRQRGTASIVEALNLAEFPMEFLLSAAVSSLPLYKDLQNV